MPLTIYRTNGLPKAAQPGVVPLVTGLPAIPSDGQEICYQADAANGVVWRARYNAASASPYKWEIVGFGDGLRSQVDADQPTSSAAFVDLATAGPSVVVPLAGDYIIEFGCGMYTSTGAGLSAFMSFAMGATAAVSIDGIWYQPSSNVGPQEITMQRSRKKTGILAGTAIVAKYSSPGATTFNFNNRWMVVKPVRVG